MDILIIGGTKFVGRAITEIALARGHHVTLFHRGQTNPDILPDAERIQGNRDGELANLGDRHWDVVIDTCGYFPRAVKEAAEYLKERVKQYVFISTISVYAESEVFDRDEDAPLATLTDETIEEVTGESYGGLKVLCEQVAEATMPGRVLVIRPGLIVGPHDPSNRFTYWVNRIRKGGDVLVPGNPDYPTQFIDVRDLADFTLNMVEQGKHGIYNATGPDYPLTLGRVYEVSQLVTDSDANFVYVDTEFLLENKVQPWMELPLWIPDMSGQALMSISVQRSIDNGLTFRSLETTIMDTLAWVDTLDGNLPGQAGMKPEREAELLATYQQKS